MWDWAKKGSIFLIIELLVIVNNLTFQAGRCAYVTCIMAVYWMTESIPIAVTALLPFILMPWLSIVPAKEISMNYFKVTQRGCATNFIFATKSKPLWLV